MAPKLTLVGNEGNHTEEPKGPLMMRGTGKQLDYLVIGRRGEIALGIKPNRIMSGQHLRFKGEKISTTRIEARLRSMRAPKLFPDDNHIVKLADQKLTTTDAWPAVEAWEKANLSDEGMQDFYSSTQVGCTIPGAQNDNPQMVLDAMKDPKLWQNFAAFLATLAGPDNLVLSEGELAEWLIAYYKPVTEQLAKAVQIEQEMEEAFSKTIGTFSITAVTMKKVLDKHKDTTAEADDIPDVDDDSHEE